MHVKSSPQKEIKATTGKQVPFPTKEINKKILTRSRLRNKFRRCRSNENIKAYNEQRNRCVKLVRNAKKLIIAILAANTSMTIKHFGKQLNSFSLKK